MSNKPPPELDWVQLRRDMGGCDDQVDVGLKNWRKIVDKCTNYPLVPFGAAVTAVALSRGLKNMVYGTKRVQQHMMRARVAAQGFTILVAVLSMKALDKKRQAERLAEASA